MVMHRQFILLLGMLLGNHGPAIAQTAAARVVQAQVHGAPITTMLPALSIPAPAEAASFQVAQNPGKPGVDFGLRFGGPYERDNRLENFSPMVEVKTLVLTQSSLPLVQIWGGRFQLDAFQNTLHLENVEHGLYDNGDTQAAHLWQSSYPGGPPSLTLTGLSLSFQFGREAQTGRSNQGWRRFPHMVGMILN
jgi:hypothetical protein